MRSETVVLPASMWAAMPMFRIFDRSRDINLVPFRPVAGGFAHGPPLHQSCYIKHETRGGFRSSAAIVGRWRLPCPESLSGSAPAGLASTLSNPVRSQFPDV